MGKRTADGEVAAPESAVLPPSVPTVPTELRRCNLSGLFEASAAHALFVAADGTAIVSLDGVLHSVNVETETIFGALSDRPTGLVELGPLSTPSSSVGIVTLADTVLSVTYAAEPGRLVGDAIELPPATAAGSVYTTGGAIIVGGQQEIVYISLAQPAHFQWTPPSAIVGVVPDRHGGPLVVLADGTSWMFLPEPTPCPLFSTVDIAFAVAVDTRTGVVVSPTAAESGIVAINHIYPFSDIPIFGTVLAATWTGHSICVLTDVCGGPEVLHATPALGMVTATLQPDSIALVTASADLPPRSSGIFGRFVMWNGSLYMVV